MLDARDLAVLEAMMRAGGHATYRGALRSALWRYAQHFAEQGLMAYPDVDDFSLSGRKG
jgi:hypothetical protein